MKAIVSLSGGMDSTTLLASVLQKYDRDDVLAADFYYGAKHNPYENRAAMAVVRHYGVRQFRHFDLEHVFAEFKSSLLNPDSPVPEGHYEEESMRMTVVPGRNIIFAAVLSGLAMSEGAREVYLGIHAGDHYIYPDCRPNFFEAMRLAVEHGTGDRVTLRSPFLNIYKSQILQIGLEMKVPYELTRTCYKPQERACGRCGSCQERLASFAACKVPDPLEYDTREIMAKK